VTVRAAGIPSGVSKADHDAGLKYACSRSSVDGPFRLQDSIPFSISEGDEHMSLRPMVCPFVDVRVK
jgi:hypothetical protein